MARSSDHNMVLALLRDKTFQAREIRRVIKISLFYLLATTALLGVFYHLILKEMVAGFAPMLFVSEDMALVNESIPSMSTVLGRWILAMMAINLLVTLALGIYVTRRLGAPLLAIKRALREIGAGNLEVQLRAGDYSDFGELANELNAAQRSIREQLAAAKSEIARAAAPMAARKSQDTGSDELPEIPARNGEIPQFGAMLGGTEDSELDQMRQAVNNCMLALDYFRVNDPASHASAH